MSSVLRSGGAIVLIGAMAACAHPSLRDAVPGSVSTVMPASGDRTLRILTRADDTTLTPLRIVLDSLDGQSRARRTALLDYPVTAVLANPSLQQLPDLLDEQMRSYIQSHDVAQASPSLEVTAGAWRLVRRDGQNTSEFELIYRATVKARALDRSGRAVVVATEHCSPQPRNMPLVKWQAGGFESVRETAMAYVSECSRQVERRFPEIFKRT